MPVCTSYPPRSSFHPLHPNYAGDLGLARQSQTGGAGQGQRSGDRGGRAAERDRPVQGYTLFDIPVPQMKLVHVYPGAEELGRVYRPHLAIHASPSRFAAALAKLKPRGPARWADQVARRPCRLSRLVGKAAAAARRGQSQSQIMIWLREHLPDDAIICNGAGNYAAWIHRFYRFRRFATQIAPICGFMGYGVPAAVAMQRLIPSAKWSPSMATAIS